jgi:CO/xanthine dehydrogenase Mo-binding subunit
MTTRTVGLSVPRTDARAKVTGEALFPGDFSMPDMLHAKIRFAGRPHARITAIDTSEAEAVEGVVAIFTAPDVPVNSYGLQIPDQPVLCGPGSSNPEGDVVRWEGDQIAIVVAETEEAAARARDRIQVTFEDLPVITDPFTALQSSAPQIHAHREPSEIHPELCTEGNRISHHQIRKGDVEVGFEQADVIVESRYHTPAQEHAYLQPEAGLAYVDDEERVTVVVGGQWTWEDQRQIARSLDLPPKEVRVIYPAIGGAFGGREDMSVQIVLALAAWELRRPVKIVWSREESIIGHCKRHPMWIHSRWGATREGKLTAVEIRAVADGGAYCYTTNKVLGNVTVTASGPYQVPHIKIDVDGVYTNNPPAGAFRGFGSPQAIFAAEMQMNKLAAELDMDPLELRLKNLLRTGSATAMQTPLPGSVSLPKVATRCAAAAGWSRTSRGWEKPEPRPAAGPFRTGIGLAVAFKNVGFSFGYQDTCWAKVELRGDAEPEEATLYIGAADVGQGSHTVIHQMAADALSLPTEAVQLEAADTATSPGSSGSVSASRMTFMAGNAIRGAAAGALKCWRAEERPAVGEYTYFAPRTTSFDPESGYSVPNFAYGYVAEVVEVEVDTETGQVRVLRVVCADDVGKAINPQLVEGQIEGGAVQAIGWATTEDLITREGCILTNRLSTYLIPTALDAPEEIISILVENPDPRGPWGARGMGEMPFIPLAPALVAAVYDATGVWFDTFPLTPQRVLEGLTGAEDLTHWEEDRRKSEL